MAPKTTSLILSLHNENKVPYSFKVVSARIRKKERKKKEET